MKTPKQLTLEIDDARSGADGQPQTSEQLIEHIIKVYGDEFALANDEIRRLNNANDELFTIKQKVVIVNRDLLRKVHELEQQLADTAQQLKNARDALRALADDEDKPRHVLD